MELINCAFLIAAIQKHYNIFSVDSKAPWMEWSLSNRTLQVLSLFWPQKVQNSASGRSGTHIVCIFFHQELLLCHRHLGLVVGFQNFVESHDFLCISLKPHLARIASYSPGIDYMWGVIMRDLDVWKALCYWIQALWISYVQRLISVSGDLLFLPNRAFLPLVVQLIFMNGGVLLFKIYRSQFNVDFHCFLVSAFDDHGSLPPY